MHSTTKTINLDKLCKRIVNSNSNIKSVKIFSESGSLLERVGFETITNTSNEDRKKNLERCLFDISLGELDDLYGPIQYHFSEGNFATFTFPFNQHLVVVTTTKNVSPISLATKIAHIIIRFS